MELSPHARIGRGPGYPPELEGALREKTAAWLSVHPFLALDSGYVDFLKPYSGLAVSRDDDPSLDWGLDIAGFTGTGGCLDEVDFCVFDPTVPAIDEKGFYRFADVSYCAYPDLTRPWSGWLGADFGYDATGERPWGIYRLLDPPQWFCSTFAEWLSRVIERKGRVLEIE